LFIRASRQYLRRWRQNLIQIGEILNDTATDIG
jgi:hypothetical protein